jgi:hypothetical protein
MCENTESKMEEMKVLRVQETVSLDRGFQEQLVGFTSMFRVHFILRARPDE